MQGGQTVVVRTAHPKLLDVNKGSVADIALPGSVEPIAVAAGAERLLVLAKTSGGKTELFERSAGGWQPVSVPAPLSMHTSQRLVGLHTPPGHCALTSHCTHMLFKPVKMQAGVAAVQPVSVPVGLLFTHVEHVMVPALHVPLSHCALPVQGLVSVTKHMFVQVSLFTRLPSSQGSLPVTYASPHTVSQSGRPSWFASCATVRTPSTGAPMVMPQTMRTQLGS